MSIAQLAGTMHYYMHGPGFEPWTPHLFTLKVNLATRLPDKKKRKK